jgi:hypothetical protein
MSQTLYTDVISNRYRYLATSTREKMNILNEFINISESISKLVEKYDILATECDNIANNHLLDIDYIAALLRVEAAMTEVNRTQASYIRDLYAEATQSLAQEP